MQKNIVILKNLTCSNCAGKIERDVNKISGLEEAFLDFANGKLIFVSSKNSVNDYFQKIKAIVKKYEPDVEVILSDGSEESDDSNLELKKERNKLIFSVLIFFIAIMYSKFFNNINIKFILFLIVYIISGKNVILKAFRNILRGKIFDENFLMVIATLGAFFIGEYPEGVAVMIFYNFGEYFQAKAVNKSRRSIKNLVSLKIEYANLITSKGPKKVNPTDVKLGDLIIVKKGEKIPIDGYIVSGESSLDTAFVTGESMPRSVEIGSEVVSGSINLSNVITIKTTKTYEHSTVSKIIELVENSAKNKAETENFITKFAYYYTPIVVVLALILAFVTPFLFGISFEDSIYRSLVFLVISCPCALVVSVPLGYFSGIGLSSKHGILIKGGNYLDALNSVFAVVFDKTGTLTKGEFRVSDVKIFNDISKEKFIDLVVHAESYSNHPIAKAILKEGGKIEYSRIKNHEEISGYGIKAIVDDSSVLVGNYKFLVDNKVNLEKYEGFETVIYVAIDGKFSGYMVIEDILREDSKMVINNLRNMGVRKLYMLTGDNELIAKKIAEELKLDGYYASLLPEDKVKKIEEIKKGVSNNKKVVFIGDGTNDAPVLAVSDIGVSMGLGGTDAAIEASDIVLMSNKISKFLEAISISKRTRSIVIQNIVFALFVKLLFLIMGAFGIIALWEAVFADVGVTVIAIINSIRILKE